MAKVLLLIISAVIIVLSLLQSGKSEGFTGAFSGGKGLDLFSNTKERGAEKVISNLTMGAGIVFFALVLFILKTQV
ncbi:preprotein translocase subunit SecG [Erysipelothrix rhusiopathiae]|uniref:Protein-export membrane protein SecG n=2 Tax=Erysipelothrix TaxID=1647 RepID=E7FY88_ERYRH|nr:MULTISPECIES: preprotein translocase subunit SecG [Erysipelothrix]UPU40203.1 preprotein translocase subunit SecG [Erysipelothrix sp. Poltava]CAH2760878.1 preprotein translocase subunit SecG [Erysipelothrix sp. A18Y020d]AGN25110.1 preprotein translocase subunit SecG [Erysipelothrix rhusiopathiae SY1027]AMS11864.1 preprotein translocase subunit SecG [Erysipelothrix rhusiopathiae]AOO68365.1 preprotein translocase subunit SecG [Erysipelothrix rhusiopathiae]